jgi:hypothetical protein
MAFSSGVLNQRRRNLIKARQASIWLEQNQHRLFGTIRVRGRWPTQTPHQAARHYANLKAEEIFMTSKEKAELFFKQERLSDSQSSIPEYEQHARAERTKTARLRELRLAREAESAPKPEEMGGPTEKLTQHKSPKTSRRHAGIRRRAVS